MEDKKSIDIEVSLSVSQIQLLLALVSRSTIQGKHAPAVVKILQVLFSSLPENIIKTEQQKSSKPDQKV